MLNVQKKLIFQRKLKKLFLCGTISFKRKYLQIWFWMNLLSKKFWIGRTQREDGNGMGKNHPYYGKSVSTNFPGSPHTKGFVAFSHTTRNWWGNSCIFHMLKYTIGWESDGKKAPILWEKYEYQFPRLCPYHGFCCISRTVGNLWGNPCIYHMMKSVNFFLWHFHDIPKLTNTYLLAIPNDTLIVKNKQKL